LQVSELARLRMSETLNLGFNKYRSLLHDELEKKSQLIQRWLSAKHRYTGGVDSEEQYVWIGHAHTGNMS